jgi:hypothetical protein
VPRKNDDTAAVAASVVPPNKAVNDLIHSTS